MGMGFDQAFWWEVNLKNCGRGGLDRAADPKHLGHYAIGQADRLYVVPAKGLMPSLVKGVREYLTGKVDCSFWGLLLRTLSPSAF